MRPEPPGDTARAAIQMLADGLRAHASAELWFTRDALDSFVVDLNPLDPDCDLARQDVLAALPRGSRWSSSLGWWSILGVPLPTPSPSRYLVGIEWVEPHESRGAYPCLWGLISASGAAAADTLAALARYLDPSAGRARSPQPSGLVVGYHHDPSAYQPTSAHVLARASALLGHGETTAFRTATLTVDELDAAVALGTDVPTLRRLLTPTTGTGTVGAAHAYVVGVPVHVLDASSFRTSLKVQAMRDRNLPIHIVGR